VLKKMKPGTYYCLLLFLYVTSVRAQDFNIEKLPDFINSAAYDEITPVPSRDGATLFFTRVGSPDFERYLFLDSVDLAKKYKPTEYLDFLGRIFTSLGAPPGDPVRSKFNQDVWVAVGDTGRFVAVQHPGPPLNNALPNSIVAITPDPYTFYCLNQFKKAGDMNRGFSIIRRNEDNGWDFPEPVSIDEYYTITSDVSLTMSFDGKVLILAASRFDSRDMDLYVCFRKGDNAWSAPQPLGDIINSEGREVTPFLAEDNVTLFFASNRSGSTGGQDIYITKRRDDSWKNWDKPVRLIEPINSRSDDSQPYFNQSSGYLYFTSRREGSGDIYRVRLTPPAPTEIVVQGRVLNSRTNELLPGAEVTYGPRGETPRQFRSKDGTFNFRIPKGLIFDMLPVKAGFRGRLDTIFFRRDYFYFREFYTLDLYAEPLEKDAVINMPSILFEQSKAIILPSSNPELERLVELLKSNPGMHIRVEGHTDNVGKPEDLLRLSEERAAAVRNYLVARCIDASRLDYVGHGARYPLNANTNDQQRRQNRRVEVRILKIK
jgi:outer membrane protein OmpA-like peptidoglycan-associated protein